MDNWSLKLDTLIKSLSKNVAQKVECCRLLEPKTGYERAMSTLFKLYGNPAQVRESVIGDLRKGGHIPKHDKEALVSLSLEVSSAHEVLKALTTRSKGKINYENAVNTDEIISEILGRIPYWIDSYTHDFKTYEERCDFSNLRTFLELKTEDALDPLVINALKRAKELSKSNKRIRGGSNNVNNNNFDSAARNSNNSNNSRRNTNTFQRTSDGLFDGHSASANSDS